MNKDKLFGSIHLEHLDIQDSVKKSHCAIGYCGIYRYSTNRMYINLGDIGKYFSSNIIKEVCIAITHEYMHKLLYNTEDRKTCKDWDNIAKDLEAYYGG